MTKTNGSTTGWKSKESIEDMREKFQNLTRRAKEMAQDGDLEESLKLYQKAYKLHKSEKVEKRIKKLEVLYKYRMIIVYLVRNFLLFYTP